MISMAPAALWCDTVLGAGDRIPSELDPVSGYLGAVPPVQQARHHWKDIQHKETALWKLQAKSWLFCTDH